MSIRFGLFSDLHATLPGAPTILSAVSGNGSVTLTWEAPENKGFPEIHSYLITAEQGGWKLFSLKRLLRRTVKTALAAEGTAIISNMSMIYNTGH